MNSGKRENGIVWKFSGYNGVHCNVIKLLNCVLDCPTLGGNKLNSGF